MNARAARARRWKEAPRASEAGSSVRLAIPRVLTTAAAVLFAGSSTVLACPMCFGAEEASLIDATKLGIVVMLAITLAVQGGFVAFFLYLRKRARQNAELELETEWSELQRSRT